MLLKIYNSLTKKKEYFSPLEKDKVNIYVCGPTVYNNIHIGNIRPIIFFNMLKKYLKTFNFKVNLVVNITDIDDKIITQAIKKKKTEKQISSHYILSFFDLLKKLKINTINSFPLVTDYIKDITFFIEKLIQKGYTYSTDSGIYFRVGLISNYGSLSKQKINKLKKNIRKKLDQKKENAEDFILWKKTNIGIKYPSPWFPGRPGWHTECVVMIDKIFHNTIDIHGGGIDLKFPHHENEQAQFLAINEKPLANFFIHIGYVKYKNEKMSKSLGNIILAKDLLSKIDSNILKLFFLSYHYSQPIDYNISLINKFSEKYEKILNILNKNNFKFILNEINNSETNILFIEKFHLIIQDDFNTPNIFTLIEELLKKMNKNENDLFFLSELQNTLLYILNILGIKIILKKINSEQIEIYHMWQNYKKKKDFKKSDFLRNILKKEGII
jgi:cysteinyl-tRNA synthetase